VDKAVFGITAGQEVAKSLFDEVRQPVSALGGIGQEAVEFLGDDSV
jgi:hypothetical protein